MRQRGCGQFLQACNPKRYKNAWVVRTQPAVVTAELFDEHEIPEFHDGPRLSHRREWSISSWLIGCLKAMQASAFEYRGIDGIRSKYEGDIRP